MSRHRVLTTPRTLLALLIAGLLALSACGFESEGSASDGDGWSYTSGDGKTYKADKVPTRIIADAYAAKVLMEFGIKPVAIWASSAVADDVGLRGADFDGIEVLGTEWGKIDAARAAELEPDLIVGDWWPVEKAYSGLEEGVEEESKKIAKLAPVVGAAQGDSIVSLIEGYADLAESLGADPKAVEDARATFDASVASFEKAVAAKPDLTALAISPYDGKYSVAVPKYAPELLDFQKWGLKVIDPAKPDPDFPYWETVDMENADKYQPDVLLFDDRNYPGNLDELEKAPISSQITAFEAKQYTTWPAYWLHTYTDYAAQLDRLTAFINEADQDLTKK